MNRKYAVVTIATLAALALLPLACANPIAPDGGPRDETPPQVVTEESTPDKQTNFGKQPIELTFNEWVVLEDIFNQVVISPPLEFRPEVRLKRRTVIFEFDEREELRPDATYTINFGEAVKDLTEKNPAENLRFVFSTGDYLDSLTVQGRVVDVLEGKPVEKVLFMLYENTADSVVRTERPFYFARTDKEGYFQIDNVKAGVFKGFALEDRDLNYRFNQAGERIGFPDSLLTVAEGRPEPFVIRLFQERQPLRVNEVFSDEYGLVRLAFNKKPENLELDYSDRVESIYFEYLKDSLRVWYDLSEQRAWNLFVRQDTSLNDTVVISPEDKAAFLENASLSPVSSPGGAQPINPRRPQRIEFNHPLRAIDTARITLYEDTLRIPVQPQLRIDSAERRELVVDFKWKEEMVYQLELLPGALTDWYGLENDTLVYDYRANPLKNYGNLTLVVEQLDSTASYVLQLNSGKMDKPLEFRARRVATFQQELTYLQPGQYVLTIITDWNDNGRWDTGNYDRQLQPEPFETRELEQLRANWELESRVILGEKPPTAEEEAEE